MKTVKINKGWFFGAGSVYGWSKGGHDLHRFGVGINMDVLKANKEIKVSVAGNTYLLNCSTALAFIEQFRSTKTIRNKRIGVVSKSILEEVPKPHD